MSILNENIKIYIKNKIDGKVKYTVIQLMHLKYNKKEQKEKYG